MKELSFIGLVFAALLIFTGGYILGVGQNLQLGHSVVREICVNTKDNCFLCSSNPENKICDRLDKN